MKKKRMSKEDKESTIRVAFYLSLGLGLSILFYYLDYKFNNTFIRTITCIISVLFMSFVLYRFHKKDNIFDCLGLDSDVDKLIVVKFTSIYFVIIFVLLILINRNICIENPLIILDCLVWAIYTMPSFILVIAVLLLLLVCLSYA